MKTTLLTLCLSLMSFHFGYSQTTNIPDENFEQALIDLGIDSDGTVNGQVLTADIENVTELDLSNEEYEDLGYNDLDITGISDFTALEIIDLQGQPIYWFSGENEDIFNSNLNLKEIHLNNFGTDYDSSIYIEKLDLSNLNNLEYLNFNNLDIKYIKLDNSNYDYENIIIDLLHEGYPRPAGPITNSDDPEWPDYWTNEVCIQVNDPEAASNNNPPYDTWTILIDNIGIVTYNFSANCNLSTENFEDLNTISVYPNPVQNKLNFENPKQINLDEVQIFNIKGQLVKRFTNIKNSINLDNLNKGVYFVKVKSEENIQTFKVLKK
ncbi:T9SS type A sorting domain-containing protein [Psychroflexus aestuariivivens]|uniref:T9SS type A sorting domain-containing protein n=1 Tax=Psychroflexus aestuariivivens TaxID=1795040 RepID=UPI000FD96439|nr:T9SS type A sorting domain-containing protein [Psychroflexus aestuariivivens]